MLISVLSMDIYIVFLRVRCPAVVPLDTYMTGFRAVEQNVVSVAEAK